MRTICAICGGTERADGTCPKCGGSDPESRTIREKYLEQKAAAIREHDRKYGFRTL